ncbi:MAG: prenyltransferase/squalene oxidase repeat-containing protein [Myxococcota bacterium]
MSDLLPRPLAVPAIKAAPASPTDAETSIVSEASAVAEARGIAPRLVDRTDAPSGVLFRFTPGHDAPVNARAVAQAAAHAMASQVDDDGRWQTRYTGGVYHGALASIAATACGAPPSDTQLEHLVRQQQQDGSFLLYPGGPKSPGATRLVALALTQRLQNIGNAGGPFAQSLEHARDRALDWCRTARPAPGLRMFEGKLSFVASRLTAVVDRDARKSPVAGMSAFCFALGSTAPAALGNFNAIFSAIGLIASEECKKTGLVSRSLDGMFQSAFSAVFRGANEASALDAVLSEQQSDGAWLYTPMITSYCMVALSHVNAEQAKPSREISDAIDRGLNYCSRAQGTGSPEHGANWTTPDQWDTASAVMCLATHHPEWLDSTAARKALSSIIEGQSHDGRWSFAAQGKVGDNDTTAIVLKSLCTIRKAGRSLSGSNILNRSIERGVSGLIDAQQGNGGWNAFSARPSSLPGTSRAEPSYTNALLDIASPDVTGRALISLIMARHSVDPELQPKLERAIAKAVSYLESHLDPNDGLTWSRWLAGRLPSSLFVIPPLVHEGALSSYQRSQVRSQLLARQNPDGGFGEPEDADRSPGLSHRTGSTPAQTAFAVAGLIACAQEVDPVVDAAAKRAVRYLADNAQPTWANRRSLYTAVRGAEYYDSDHNTTVAVLAVLDLYQNYVDHGPRYALARVHGSRISV